MKTIAYIQILAILLSSFNLDKEDLKSYQEFFHNAAEHFQSGDSFFEFLSKHYGDKQTVLQHYQESHPDKKPFEKPDKHHHKKILHEVVYFFQTHLLIFIKHYYKTFYFYQNLTAFQLFFDIFKPPRHVFS